MGILRKQSGFTLIEIAIVVLIAGILIASFSQVAKMYFVEKKDQELKNSLNIIVAHLSEYVRDSSVVDNPATVVDETFVDPDVHYPCPAAPNLAPTHPNYGLENRNPTTNACQATNGVILSGNVYIGTVPFRTIEVSADDTVDPWGNKFTYAVSANVTPLNSLRNANPPGAVLIATAAAPTSTIGSHFALVSHGPSGAGAWSPQGARIACSAAATVDQENCDDDATFLDGSLAYSTAQNANFYDDKMIYTLEGLGDTDIEQFWRLNPADTTEIHNTNTGNVGVGVTDPRFSLHVSQNGDEQYTGLEDGGLELYRSTTGFNGLWSQGYIDFKDDPIEDFDMRLSYQSSQKSLSVQNKGPKQLLTIHDTGKVGVGVNSPQTQLDVDGEVKINSTGVACTAAIAGSIRFNTAENRHEACSGNTDSPPVFAWRPLGGGINWGDSCRTIVDLTGKKEIILQCNADEFLVSATVSDEQQTPDLKAYITGYGGCIRVSGAKGPRVAITCCKDTAGSSSASPLPSCAP